MTDIIIPLFNGYAFFKDCFESILNNTEKGSYRIIIVDDCSTEKRLLSYLEDIKKLDLDDVVILKKEENSGFVKSVNLGMRINSINDIILLNSDTVVTKNWLKKVKECAYSSENIATVTTLTNNGTICSVPRWLQDNKIPDGFNIETFALLIENVSKKEYPVIPTAVGFCMFIKRSVLNKVGYFDEESYGKGYGEENDFSMRIRKYGYKNVLDDATFIYHKGHMSFSPEDYKLLTRNNSLILSEKYPSYNKDVENFIKNDPFKNIINRINVGSKKILRSNILYFIHSNPYESFGGTEKHTLHMVEISLQFFNYVYLMYYSGESFILERHSNSLGRETLISIKSKNETGFGREFCISNINKIFSDIISFYSIKNVHFQHLLNMPLSLIETSGQANLNIYITAHDYYLLCPYPHLYTGTGKKQSCVEGECNNCADKEFHDGFISRRRNNISNFINKYVTNVFFPTNHLKYSFEKYYPLCKNKFVTIGHPYVIGRNPGIITNRSKELKAKKSFAFLGSFSVHKGSRLFTQLVLESKDTYDFFIFGKIEDFGNYEKIKNLVGHIEFKNIHNLKENIEKYDIDAVLLLSVIPETFSFTLSEAIILGIPVIASSLGAFAERLNNYEGAVLFDIDGRDILKTKKNLQKALNFFENNKKNGFSQKAIGLNIEEYNNGIIKKYKKYYLNK